MIKNTDKKIIVDYFEKCEKKNVFIIESIIKDEIFEDLYNNLKLYSENNDIRVILIFLEQFSHYLDKFDISCFIDKITVIKETLRNTYIYYNYLEFFNPVSFYLIENWDFDYYIFKIITKNLDKHFKCRYQFHFFLMKKWNELKTNPKQIEKLINKIILIFNKSNIYLLIDDSFQKSSKNKEWNWNNVCKYVKDYLNNR